MIASKLIDKYLKENSSGQDREDILEKIISLVSKLDNSLQELNMEVTDSPTKAMIAKAINTTKSLVPMVDRISESLLSIEDVSDEDTFNLNPDLEMEQ